MSTVAVSQQTFYGQAEHLVRLLLKPVVFVVLRAWMPRKIMNLILYETIGQVVGELDLDPDEAAQRLGMHPRSIKGYAKMARGEAPDDRLAVPFMGADQPYSTKRMVLQTLQDIGGPTSATTVRECVNEALTRHAQDRANSTRSTSGRRKILNNVRAFDANTVEAALQLLCEDDLARLENGVYWPSAAAVEQAVVMAESPEQFAREASFMQADVARTFDVLRQARPEDIERRTQTGSSAASVETPAGDVAQGNSWSVSISNGQVHEFQDALATAIHGVCDQFRDTKDGDSMTILLASRAHVADGASSGQELPPKMGLIALVLGLLSFVFGVTAASPDAGSLLDYTAGVQAGASADCTQVVLDTSNRDAGGSGLPGVILDTSNRSVVKRGLNAILDTSNRSSAQSSGASARAIELAWGSGGIVGADVPWIALGRHGRCSDVIASCTREPQPA